MSNVTNDNTITNVNEMIVHGVSELFVFPLIGEQNMIMLRIIQFLLASCLFGRKIFYKLFL